MRERTRRHVMIVSLLALAACEPPRQPAGNTSAAPRPAVIQTIQQGDSALTCPEIVAQMGEMDQIMYSPPSGSAVGVAGQAAGGALQMVPFAGRVLGSAASGGASSYAREAAMQHQMNVQMAQRRRQALMALYQKQKC